MSLTAVYNYPQNGYHPAAQLEVGKEYTVEYLNMDRYSTDIRLAGYTGIFNSVQFDFFEDGEPINIYRSPKYNPYMQIQEKKKEIKYYNKLVRDRIPEIIEASGARCETRILTDAEYLEALNTKLDEELAEYHESGDIEELADLMEVIYAITLAKGYSIPQLFGKRARKAGDRGGFRERILLVSVEEG